jgi:hypothetical protein
MPNAAPRWVIVSKPELMGSQFLLGSLKPHRSFRRLDTFGDLAPAQFFA